MMDDSIHSQTPVRQVPQGFFSLCASMPKAWPSDGEWVVVVSSDGLILLGSSLLYSVVYCVPICGIRIAQVVSLVNESQSKGYCIHGGLVI